MTVAPMRFQAPGNASPVVYPVTVIPAIAKLIYSHW